MKKYNISVIETEIHSSCIYVSIKSPAAVTGMLSNSDLIHHRKVQL